MYYLVSCDYSVEVVYYSVSCVLLGQLCITRSVVYYRCILGQLFITRSVVYYSVYSVSCLLLGQLCIHSVSCVLQLYSVSCVLLR